MIPSSKKEEKERRKSAENATKKRAQTLFGRKSARFLCNYIDLIQESQLRAVHSVIWFRFKHPIILKNCYTFSIYETQFYFEKLYL